MNAARTAGLMTIAGIYLIVIDRCQRDSSPTAGAGRIDADALGTLRAVIEQKGVFCVVLSGGVISFYSQGWRAGGQVSSDEGRSGMKELGIQMIPAYSPQARGGVKPALEPANTGRAAAGRHWHTESGEPVLAGTLRGPS